MMWRNYVTVTLCIVEIEQNVAVSREATQLLSCVPVSRRLDVWRHDVVTSCRDVTWRDDVMRDCDVVDETPMTEVTTLSGSVTPTDVISPSK